MDRSAATTRQQLLSFLPVDCETSFVRSHLGDTSCDCSIHSRFGPAVWRLHVHVHVRVVAAKGQGAECGAVVLWLLRYVLVPICRYPSSIAARWIAYMPQLFTQVGYQTAAPKLHHPSSRNSRPTHLFCSTTFCTDFVAVMIPTFTSSRDTHLG